MKTVTVKTSELEGAALDWAYNKAKANPRIVNMGEKTPYVSAKGKRKYVAMRLGNTIEIPQELTQ